MQPWRIYRSEGKLSVSLTIRRRSGRSASAASVSLNRLVEEIDGGGSELLQATVFEVLRTRPIIDAVSRQVTAPSIQLEPWVIPRHHTVTVNIGLVHRYEYAFPDADRFDVDRFLRAGPETYSWVPFGGGSRRCPGAAFANLEMLVVLRTMLREYRLAPTDAPDERVHDGRVKVVPQDADPGPVELCRLV